MYNTNPSTWKGVTYHVFNISAESNGMNTTLRLPKGSTEEQIIDAVWKADGINLDVNAVSDYVIVDMTTGLEVG